MLLPPENTITSLAFNLQNFRVREILAQVLLHPKLLIYKEGQVNP